MDADTFEPSPRTVVEDTVTRLFVNTDERNWKGVEECFAPKVLLDESSVSGNKPSRMSRKKMADLWESGMKGFAAAHHQTGNTLVSVEGDEASAFCYVTETQYFPNPTGKNTYIIAGTYDMHLMKGEEGWRVDIVRFNLRFTEGNALLAELAKKAARKQ